MLLALFVVTLAAFRFALHPSAVQEEEVAVAVVASVAVEPEAASKISEVKMAMASSAGGVEEGGASCRCNNQVSRFVIAPPQPM